MMKETIWDMKIPQGMYFFSTKSFYNAIFIYLSYYISNFTDYWTANLFLEKNLLKEVSGKFQKVQAKNS